MKVILKEDLKSLGKMGSVVNVSDGYARNFLIPKKIAVEANTKNVKALEHEKRLIKERAGKLNREAQGMSEKLSSVKLTLSAKAGEEERLFGSITTMDIAEALKKEGLEIDRKRIVLDEPIKRLGSYTVAVKISPDITGQLSVQIIAE
ncbi:MAG: 50S ribosomal protein L9 [Nitrospirota bacterium]